MSDQVQTSHRETAAQLFEDDGPVQWPPVEEEPPRPQGIPAELPSSREPTRKQHRTGEHGSEPRSRRSELDEAAERLKLRRKKRDIDESIVLEQIQNLLNSMRIAADQDNECLANNEPAVHKLAIVDTVTTEVTKPALSGWYMQEGFLGHAERWLAPLPDGSLPNLALRSKMLQCLAKTVLPSDAMANTHFGERLLEIWRHPDETDENRAVIRQIVLQTVKPILGMRYQLGAADVDRMTRVRPYSRPKPAPHRRPAPRSIRRS